MLKAISHGRNRTKIPRWLTNALLTPILTKMIGKMQHEAPTTANTLVKTPPFANQPLLFSCGLSISAMLTSVVTTDSSEKSVMITIGKLSRETGVKIETIRYYEKIALMPNPLRKESGHRVYDIEQVNQLKFIKRARELGFSLSDIRDLIGADSNPPSCSEVFTLTHNHITNIREKISDLKKLEKRLSSIAKNCEHNNEPNCPIIDVLSV